MGGERPEGGVPQLDQGELCTEAGVLRRGAGGMLFRRGCQMTNTALLSSQDEDRLKKFEPQLFLVYGQINITL
jgi:hypothetical protein